MQIFSILLSILRKKRKKLGVGFPFVLTRVRIHHYNRPGTELQGGHVPPTFGQGGTQYLLSPPIFCDNNNVVIQIYL